MTLTKILLTQFLLFIALGVSADDAFAQRQTDDPVLVSGKYTLRQTDIDRLTEIYEWLLASRFTAGERRQYQKLIVAEARVNERTAGGIASMLESYDKIMAATPEKREEVRRQLLPEIVAIMEKDDSEASKLLLSLHRKSEDAPGDDNQALNDSPSVDSNRQRTGGGAVTVADLAGIWSTSSVSGTRYKSLVTGELSDPSGSIIEYQISPNGTIKHVGYLSSTVYSCTTKLFISRTGRISINGSNITFDFAPGKRMYQTCSQSASRNDTLPAERKTQPFRLGPDEYGIMQLCTTDENGKDFCIRKKGQ
ncbi:MAG TPA: hypothetical protein VIL74_03935 [Pyrinomonadaceae bacterium]|jgi:hypothetical protein